LKSVKSKFSYVILGSGRWGARISKILCDMGKDVSHVAVEKKVRNNREKYLKILKHRLNQLKKTNSVLWVAIPPGYQYEISKIATELGFHQVFEKPWNVTMSQSCELAALCKQKKVTVGVHFQYCYLDKLELISKNTEKSDKQCFFSGVFTIDKSNKLGLDPVDNLGIHLAAIWQQYFNEINFQSLVVGYDSCNERSITISDVNGDYVSGLDFSINSEPIVQRFVENFEDCINNEESFKYGIEFAGKVNVLISKFK